MKNVFMACDTKSGSYCTDLDAYTSKQQISVHAKYFNKEIMSPIYLSGPHTNYISVFT